MPAGPFVQGSQDGDPDERPKRRVDLPAFALDRTEVTAGDYAACVRRRRCRPTPGAPQDDPRLPVVRVSWHDATAYCRFAGGRLPSDAEWEKAARGPDGRRFPWGAGARCDAANWGSWAGEGPCGGQNPGRPIAVGQRTAGASPYGILDLAGNVWEWVADARGRLRSVRGGSCCSEMLEPRAANRVLFPSDYRDDDLGFRCAYDRRGDVRRER